MRQAVTQEQEKINRWFKKHGWNHQTFFNRPDFTRRRFFQIAGASQLPLK